LIATSGSVKDEKAAGSIEADGTLSHDFTDAVLQGAMVETVIGG